MSGRGSSMFTVYQVRHPERSECAAFAQSKDLAAFTRDVAAREGFVIRGRLAAFFSKQSFILTR